MQHITAAIRRLGNPVIEDVKVERLFQHGIVVNVGAHSEILIPWHEVIEVTAERGTF